jgi:serine-type D-Ala-D-Ala carboxypeptidase (penicillin-binding protein 5/6)
VLENQEAKFSVDERESIESFEERVKPILGTHMPKSRTFVLCFFPLLFLLTSFFFINKFLFFHYDLVPRGELPKISVAEQKAALPQVFAFPLITEYPQSDDYSSKSVLIYDLDSNVTLYQKNAFKKTYIASLTKLASTKVSFDSLDLSQEIVIGEGSVEFEGSALSLKKDQKFTRFDLLKAAVVASSNQAIYAIDKPETTVEKMNALKEALMLDTTNFSNPAGYDEDGNYSSADDLVELSKLFFNTPKLREFASLPTTEILDHKENKKIKVATTNDMLKLNVKEVRAGKTGTTLKASQNLVLLVEKNGKEYLVILLNGIDRYKDAFKVIERL